MHDGRMPEPPLGCNLEWYLYIFEWMVDGKLFGKFLAVFLPWVTFRKVHVIIEEW